MPLEFRTQRDGRLRKVWFGSFAVNGKRRVLNLGIKIAGQPPASLSLKDDGDAAFEWSRATARAKLDGIVTTARSKQSAVHILEELYTMQTGETVRSVPVASLPDEWEKIERNHVLSGAYVQYCRATLARFVAFLAESHPGVDDISQVTRPMVKAFMETEGTRGVCGRTRNGVISLLRCTFKSLLPPGGINPFADVRGSFSAVVHRKPFSPEELKTIVDVVRPDEFLRPLVITGICTAMRRGDCCLLKWSDVDLERRFLTVKTAKTGATVSIPIFSLLLDELAPRAAALRAAGKPLEGYVFPALVEQFRSCPSVLSRRVKRVLARAFGIVSAAGVSPKALAVVPKAELLQAGLKHLESLTDVEARTRKQAAFKLYVEGTKMPKIAEKTGLTYHAIYAVLVDVEEATGCQIPRRLKSSRSEYARVMRDCSVLNVNRADSGRRASVRDFHCFRVTWVTLALTAGVPLELVRKVTGHQTAEIVLKHYFQPGREAFRDALTTAMPKLLTDGGGSIKAESGKLKAETDQGGDQRTEIRDQILAIAGKATAETALGDMKRIVELAERMQNLVDTQVSAL